MKTDIVPIISTRGWCSPPRAPNRKYPLLPPKLLSQLRGQDVSVTTNDWGIDMIRVPNAVPAHFMHGSEFSNEASAYFIKRPRALASSSAPEGIEGLARRNGFCLLHFLRMGRC